MLLNDILLSGTLLQSKSNVSLNSRSCTRSSTNTSLKHFCISRTKLLPELYENRSSVIPTLLYRATAVFHMKKKRTRLYGSIKNTCTEQLLHIRCQYLRYSLYLFYTLYITGLLFRSLVILIRLEEPPHFNNRFNKHQPLAGFTYLKFLG